MAQISDFHVASLRRRPRSLTDKLLELSERSPKDVAAIEHLVDVALARVNANETPRSH